MDLSQIYHQELLLLKKKSELNIIFNSSIDSDKFFNIKKKIKLNKKINPPINGIAFLCIFF